ncbi:MAG: patatin-like phospholipase family protein [Saprospiraceae bacterium]
MRKYLLLINAVLLVCSLKGQTSPPKLGLALSGGGAKGLAHIGVLKVLEENGIYPDLVTGTSMGSIVGGLYSIGYSPDELNEFAVNLNWDDYFNDSYPRAFLPVEEKVRADRYQLTFAIENGKLKIPRGLIQGKKIQTLLAGLTVPAHGLPDFDTFCLPFRCVATDLETGEAVVFSSGPLRRAIRSSMSIPSAFEPVEVEDRLLVDGLVVRNFPVQDALDMGADVVIGVDVGSLLYEREEINSVLTVLDQTSSFGSAASTLKQRELADFLIFPDLKGYSTLSYDKADSLIIRGEMAARKAMPALLATLDSLGIDLPRKDLTCDKIRRDSFNVVDVRFAGPEAITLRTLKQLFHAKTPRIFTIRQLSDEIGRLYASGFFNLVDYELKALGDENYQLTLTANAAPAWFVRSSINYDTDYKAGLLLNLTGRNLLMRGAIMSADLRISENPAVLLDYLVYTRSSPSIGLKWHGGINFFTGKKYENYRLVDEFSFHHFNTRLSFLSGVSRTWTLEGGLFAEHLSQNRKFFTQENDDSFAEQVGMFLKLSRDTYDRTYFPTDGSLTTLHARWTFGGRLEERIDQPREISLSDNLMITARLHKVFPLGSHWSLSWINGAGLVNYRQRSFLNQLYIGREVPGEEPFFEVMGLRYMELPVTAFATSGLQVRTRLAGSYFVGLTYNALWYASSERQFLSDGNHLGEYTSDWFHGLGLELGALSALGPLRLTTEYNLDLGRFNFSMTLGYRF